MRQMGGALLFADGDFKISKEERIRIAKQIASTVERTTEEISYINTSDIQDMPKEERTWIAKKIASSVLNEWEHMRC